MQETKFILHGQFHRDNGWIMNDQLGYIKETKEDTCFGEASATRRRGFGDASTVLRQRFA